MQGGAIEQLNPVAFVEKEPYEKGFSGIFEQHVRPKLSGLEEKRLSLEKEHKKRWKIGLPLMVASVAFFIIIYSQILEPNQMSLIYFAIVIGGIYHWVTSPVREYTKSAKENIIPEVLKFFGNFGYSIGAGIPDGVLSASKIMPSHTYYNSEDYIQGTYKNVGIELNEAELQQKRGKHTVTVFRGQIIRFTINKNFKGQTLVTTDAGRVGNFFGNMFSGDMKKVALEDPKFESFFEVKSTDQIEARYLLTTAFMERLIKLSELYKNKSIQCSFFSDTLFIAIPSSLNLFEPGPISVSVYDIGSIHTFLAQMHYVFDIADQLNLTSTTGL